MSRVSSLHAPGLAVACAAALSLAPSSARAQERRGDTAAEAANKGLRFGITPMIAIPTDDGPLGGGLAVDGRYGFAAGPTIVAPGGRLSGYFASARFVGAAMPTIRLTVPVGPFAPYVLGGVGPGWVSNPSEGGVALLGGGGLMVHFARILGVGAEATYQTITGTEFQSWVLGPHIVFGG